MATLYFYFNSLRASFFIINQGQNSKLPQDNRKYYQNGKNETDLLSSPIFNKEKALTKMQFCVHTLNWR